MNIHFAAQSSRLEAWFTRQLRFLACVSGLFALLTWQVAAQTNPLVVSTVAGLANFGSADGIDSAAKFLLPAGVAVDGAGNVYVADANNFTIRKISINGVVTTIAGQAGIWGSSNALATNGASFLYPYGVAIDGSNNIYVADTENHLIRKIANGSVTTLAGQAGTHGSSNGMGTNAQFYYPYGLATDSAGNVYVADTFNSAIRKITTNGGVTTIGGSASPAFSYPFAVATDSATNVYVADTYNFLIRLITPAGAVTTIAVSASPAFYYPYGIAVDSATNIYVAEYYNQIIRKITPGGAVSTLAGETNAFGGGLYGDADGSYPTGTFKNPWGVAVDSMGNVYVGDSGNGNVRKITRPSDALSTLAGPDESYGVYGDGPAGQPRFNQPNGVAVDGASNVYVADTQNNCIRMVTPAGTITTLAGSINGYSGSADGANYGAAFNNPSGLCLDAATNIYVADYDNSTVRKITPDATHSNWVTTTIAGQAGITGENNGTNATFDGPCAVAVDSATNLYVTDVTNKIVRKLTLSGTNWAVTNYNSFQFGIPNGIAVDSHTNVYVADSGNNLVYIITNGGVTTFATNDAGLLNSPKGVAVDSAGNIYVANSGTNTILGMTPGDKITIVIAGTAGLTGSADGLGSAARFDSPIGLAVDASGNVYVADALNNTIRKGTPDTAQTAVLTLDTSPNGLPLEVNGINYASTPQVFALAAGSVNTNIATTTNGYTFTNWTVGGTVVSTSSNYTFTLGSNETLVANFLMTRPLLSITRSNGVTILFWPSSATGFTLNSATNLNAANWEAVSNTPAVSGGYCIVSNTWPDQTRFFQLILQ
jgi:sugar lactone lactonase YvrE